MGVSKLWQLLEKAEEGRVKALSECSGESWAVDLSAWIVHGRTGGEGKGVSPTFTMMRTVFSRALCLLRHGIRPIIVMDGCLAPEVKSHTLSNRCERTYGQSKASGHVRIGMRETNNMCKGMLEALGLTVVTSEGEAEKTCAQLNRKGIVDACLSDDSDTFLYGATTVYSNLDVKSECVKEHKLSDIHKLLKLDQKDLVLMALLSGCDYGSGVKGVGPKKVLDLVQGMKKTSSDDVLERVSLWRENKELDCLQQEKKRLSSMPKSSHCSQCQHPGSVSKHRKEGCSVCKSAKLCESDNNIPCTCEYDKLEQHIAPYATELEMREKAMKDHSFPDKRLLKEFLENTETFDFSEVKVELPRWERLAAEMEMSYRELMRKMIPVLVMMGLHGSLSLQGLQPLRILRESQHKQVPCYLVMWKQFEFDKWTSQFAHDVETTPQAKKTRQ